MCFFKSNIVLGGQIIIEYIMNSGLIWLSWGIHILNLGDFKPLFHTQYKGILTTVFEIFPYYQSV